VKKVNLIEELANDMPPEKIEDSQVVSISPKAESRG